MPNADTTQLRRAAKEHMCSEHNYHAIRPGDLYLFCACPPWHECNRSKKWWIIRACLRCANEYAMHTSDTRLRLESITKEKELLQCQGSL